MGSYWLKEDVSVDENWRMRWIRNKVGGDFFFFFFILWIRVKFTCFAFYVWFWDVDFETHLNPFLLLASMYDAKGRLGIASNGKQYENEHDIWEIILVFISLWWEEMRLRNKKKILEGKRYLKQLHSIMI